MVSPPPPPPDDDDVQLPPEGEGDEHAHSEVEGDPSDLFAGLTHKQSLAVIALMSEPSIERAAQKAGTSERSLSRWLTQPAFQRAYRMARRQAFQQAIGLVVKYAPLAVSTLVKVIADDTAPHHARVTASATLLKFGREGIELDDLASRIETIEASLDIGTPRTRLNGATRNGWSN